MQEIPSNLAMWSLFVGFILPALLAIVIQQGWSRQAKAVAAFLGCLLAGAGTAYFAGNFEGRDIATCALIVLTVAQSTYAGFWRPTGIAPTIMTATSLP